MNKNAQTIIFRSVNFFNWNLICFPEKVGILLTKSDPIVTKYMLAMIGVS